MKWIVNAYLTSLMLEMGGCFRPATFDSRRPIGNLVQNQSGPRAAESRLFADPGRSSKFQLSRAVSRFDTIKSAGLENDGVKQAGLFGKVVGKLHGPKTYLLLSAIAGFRWDWCFRSPFYWFAVGFCIKWYRARYVFKIPVWDRQPNWNNVITSKEQEKDLKAFTCKTCGSTIFIAKSREFFFEGHTGFGGLGCFGCGAKGKENFVMDRDRIVEDVGDEDDYFDYERPLDFVSRAERRKLLREAEGNEDKANQILAERTTGIAEAPAESDGKTENVLDATRIDEETSSAAPVQESDDSKTAANETEKDNENEMRGVINGNPQESEPPLPTTKPFNERKPQKPADEDDDDIMDLLDMDL